MNSFIQLKEKLKSIVMNLLFLFVFLLGVGCSSLNEDNANYHFDNKGISREVLENYLKRSVTMAEFLTVDPFCNDATYPDKDDDVRLIKNIGAKFIGRAIYRWGDEIAFSDPEFLFQAQKLIEEIHSDDSDVVFQAAIFEIVTRDVNAVKIPEWVFQEMGLPVEERNFNYNKMLDPNGQYINQWAKGHSVPDITQLETQLWFMYLAGSYIEIGCEALHFGQIYLVGMNDPQYEIWSVFLKRIRDFGNVHARRGWVLIDAHTPEGGILLNGKSLLDFNSFPLRIKEVLDVPIEGVLEIGYLDAIYGRSKECVTPSGWYSKSLPYLVEFDNFNVSDYPGVADTSSHFIWGYDEITWFYLQSEQYQKGWLSYAYDWIHKNDPSGNLQMPVSRLIDRGPEFPIIKNRANTRTKKIPYGMNLEETIKEIWNTNIN